MSYWGPVTRDNHPITGSLIDTGGTIQSGLSRSRQGERITMSVSSCEVPLTTLVKGVLSHSCVIGDATGMNTQP